MANVTGTGGADWIDQWFHLALKSTHDDDTIDGLAGDDIIDGGWGNDIIHGGDDKDTVAGHEDDFWDPAYFVGNYNPFDYGYVDDDILFGDDGNDLVYDFFGNDTLNGGDDNDTVQADFVDTFNAYDFATDTDTLNGDGGDDQLIAYQGTDVLHGGEGNDLILHGVRYLDLQLRHVPAGDAYGVANGDDGDDTLRGGVNGTTFFGGDGNDTIAAHAGDDHIYGGNDHDILVGGTGADTINGDDGHDTIFTYGTRYYHPTGWLTSIESWEMHGIAPYEDTDKDTVDAGAGNDAINAGAGDDIDGGSDQDVLQLSVWLNENTAATTFDGGAGNDRATFWVGTLEQGGAGIVTPITFVVEDNFTVFGLSLLNIEAITFYSGNGADEITGGIFDDLIDGKGGDDKLRGGDGGDYLYGGANNDTLIAGFGEDYLDGGTGVDTADYSLESEIRPLLVLLTAGVAVELFDGGNQSHTDILDSIENVIGTAGADSMVGDDFANILEGRDGNDALAGGIGSDILRGGNDDDIINGGEDTDFLDGGSGIDTLSYADFGVGEIGIDVNLATGFSSDDHIQNFENVIGGPTNDTLKGSNDRNVLEGRGGNDTLKAHNTPGGVLADWDLLDGGENDDKIFGSLGTTVMVGGAGHDIIEGGDGAEAIFAAAVAANDLQHLLGGVGVVDPTMVTSFKLDEYDQFNATDTIGDELSGGLGGDLIIGAAGDDVINGDGGDDVIRGGEGFDFLYGNSGNDVINGGWGFDIIDGGPDIDSLYGGDGADTFIVTSLHEDPDDFSYELIFGGDGIDTVDFSQLGARLLVIMDVPSNGFDIGFGATFGSGDHRSGYGNTFENVIGGVGDDEFRGDGEINRFEGGGGRDTLNGRGGGDTLLGGDENDTLIGDAGDDTIDGGSGIDTATFSGPKSAYTITKSAGVLQVSGPDGTDTLTRVEKLEFEDETADVVDDPDLNTPPNDVSLTNTTTAISEATSTASRIKVADIVVTDDDVLGSEVLAVAGTDAAFFEIDGTELFLKARTVLNFESKTSYAVAVTADDPTVGAAPDATSATYTLNVTDANEAPGVSLTNTTISIGEATSTATPIKVADIAVTDDALGSTVLGLTGADAAFFEIVGSELFLKAGTALDFESKASYAVAVTVDDAGIGAGPDATSATYTLDVTDANEAPSAVALASAAAVIGETTSTANRVKVADIVVTDDDLGSAVLAVVGTDAAFFEIVGSALFLKAGTVLNAASKPSYAVEVTADDTTVGATPDVTSVTYTLNVTDGNAPPLAVSLTNATLSLSEITPTADPVKIADIVVTDDAVVGNGVLGVTGADAAFFDIVGSTLVLKAGTLLDFETKTSFAVAVTADDTTVGGTPDVTSATHTLNITDGNEAPTVALTNTTASIGESTSTASRIKVADITVTDDALGSEVLGLAGTDAALFEIVGSELFLKANTVLDFESKQSYAVAVTVDDTTIAGTPDATSATHTLNVTDVNEGPSAVALANTTAAISESTSTASRIKVADITVTDDALGSEVLGLAGADAASFEIDGSALFLRANTALNFEVKSSYAVAVTVNDGSVGGTPDATSATYTLNVADANEAPGAVALANTTVAISENTSTASRIKVADIVVSDDALGSEVLGLTGSDTTFFEIVGSALFLRAGTVLDFESKASYAVAATVDDTTIGATPDATSPTYTLTITDVTEVEPDPPTGTNTPPVDNTPAPMDFDGDGRSDILWQHTNGAITEWLMTGTTTFRQTGLIGGGGDPNWRVVSSGDDFNGDGKADLLWQHKNGAVTLWFMDGENFTQTGLIGGGGDPNWAIKGTGDFNSDGRADIAWQHTGGGGVLWFGNGTGEFTQSDVIGTSGGPNWEIEATGDINGDGFDDILWQRAEDGAAAAWVMNGTTFQASTFLHGSGGDPNWDLRTSGDFNDDGMDDILLQHSSGAVIAWLMNGTAVTPSGLIGGNGDPNWEVKGAGDYDNDGRADLIWQQHGTGAVFTWQMNGFNFTPSGLIGGGGDPNWQVIALG